MYRNQWNSPNGGTADTPDLESGAEKRVGSSPTLGTK